MSPTTTTGGLVCAHHHLYSALGARHARAAPPARVVPGDPGADLVAARCRAGPGDVALVGDARRARGAGVRDDRDRRPSRVAERDRGQPDRDRGRLCRSRRACRRARTASPTGTARPAPRRGWPRTRGSSAPVDAAWSASTRPSPAPTRRSRPRPTSPRDLGTGVHVHVAEAHRRCGCREATRPSHHRRVAVGALRAPRGRRRSARHHRAQPAEQHEQRGRLRPARSLRQPGGARHRRDRRRHARRVPARLRPPARRRRHRDARRRLAVARERLRARSRGPRRSGHLGLRVGRSVAARVHHPACAPLDVVVDGETVLAAGRPTRVDADEIRARAAEQAGRLFSKLSEG